MQKTVKNCVLLSQSKIIVKWFAYFLDNAIFLFLIPTLKRIMFKKKWYQLHNDFQFFARIALWIFGINSVLENSNEVDLNQQYIMVSNHRSWFDQIAIMAIMPKNVHFLAKSEYFKIPLFKYCLQSYQVIPVHNQKLQIDVSSGLNNYLQKGDNVVFFVEGTRGSGRELLPFRPGAFKQAARTGIPILPLYILGSEQCLSKKNTLLSVKKGQILVIIGKPVYFTPDNLNKQMAEFEAQYRLKHDQFYREF